MGLALLYENLHRRGAGRAAEWKARPGRSDPCGTIVGEEANFASQGETRRGENGGQQKRGQLPRGKGIGVGCGGFVSGAGYPIYRSDFPHSNAIVRVQEDGRAASTVASGARLR